MVPQSRIRVCNSAEVRDEGEFVLYWMIAFRRLHSNFSLQRAVDWAVKLKKPLVIFEPLRTSYRWASDRIHKFVIDGMAEKQAHFEKTGKAGVLYFPYIEQKRHEENGLLAALAQHSCVVITDDFPSFFLPRMVSAAAARLPVRMESVDSNGLFPMHATDRVFTTAFSFRAFLQKQLPAHLEEFPKPDPLKGVRLPPLDSLPTAVTKRWPAASGPLLQGDPAALAKLPIDHSVKVVADTPGGTAPARERLKTFLDQHLSQYAAGANDPDSDNRSGLSPYLHFGHISPHELFHELMTREGWSPASLGKKTGGKKEGWWGVSAGAESWLDEFITWREIGYNMASHQDNYEEYESLPEWAQATLAKHEKDPREAVYTLEEFAAGKTHDPLWNAAQMQLLREGRIHNYLRMLWGKKILEWTSTPREALDVMVELNNKYALDGRNPNSYSGIFWVLGRYDRPWGPERPVFGTIRFMSSDNTRKKVKVRDYLQRFQSRQRQDELF